MGKRYSVDKLTWMLTVSEIKTEYNISMKCLVRIKFQGIELTFPFNQINRLVLNIVKYQTGNRNQKGVK